MIMNTIVRGGRVTIRHVRSGIGNRSSWSAIARSREAIMSKNGADVRTYGLLPPYPATAEMHTTIVV